MYGTRIRSWLLKISMKGLPYQEWMTVGNSCASDHIYCWIHWCRIVYYCPQRRVTFRKQGFILTQKKKYRNVTKTRNFLRKTKGQKVENKKNCFWDLLTFIDSKNLNTWSCNFHWIFHLVMEWEPSSQRKLPRGFSRA